MDSIIQNIDGLDENDLNFDGLDSDEDQATTKTTKSTNSASKSTKSPINESARTINNEEDEDDEILNKIPLDIPSTNRIGGKNDEVKTNTFNFDDADAEDDFIRSQSIFSSTQSTTNAATDSSSDITPAFKIPVIKKSDLIE